MIALPQYGQMIFTLSEDRNNSATSTGGLNVELDRVYLKLN